MRLFGHMYIFVIEGPGLGLGLTVGFLDVGVVYYQA